MLSSLHPRAKLPYDRRSTHHHRLSRTTLSLTGGSCRDRTHIMCSYLYAVFSLKRNLPGVAGEMVARWRDAILSVAIEEMAHLVNVANLSIAVGGEPHFGRPNFPIDPGHFPSGVVVRLTPVSRETLEHFVHLERPQGVEGEDAASFDKPDYDREEAYHGVM